MKGLITIDFLDKSATINSAYNLSYDPYKKNKYIYIIIFVQRFNFTIFKDAYTGILTQIKY